MDGFADAPMSEFVAGGHFLVGSPFGYGKETLFEDIDIVTNTGQKLRLGHMKILRIFGSLCLILDMAGNVIR